MRGEGIGKKPVAQHRHRVLSRPARTLGHLGKSLPRGFADFSGVWAGIEARRRSRRTDPSRNRQRQQMWNPAGAQCDLGGLRNALQELDRTVGAHL
jgi:hypothetical protein